MHTHISAVAALHGFLQVAVVGGLWRLGAGHLVTSSNSTCQLVGQAMLFQY